MTTEVRDEASDRGASATGPISFIGVEAEAAPFGFALLRAWIVGRHRRGIDDDARARRGYDIWRLRRLRPDRLWRRRDRGRRNGRGDRLGRGRRRRGRYTFRWGGD